MRDSDHLGDKADWRPVVALIGMPGAGKSTIGRAAARQLGVPFVDCDRAIEERSGSTISSLFARDGEASFRDLESAVLASLIGSEASLIATGGGAVLRTANRDLLRTRTHCVYLRATHDLLWKRLRRDRRRPLLQFADAEDRLREMGAARGPLYEEAAGVVIDVDNVPVEGVVSEMMRFLSLERRR